jgi:galactose mutarotase-like enzyme
MPRLLLGQFTKPSDCWLWNDREEDEISAFRKLKMKTIISPSTYKDQRAITIETGQVRAQFLPDQGSKLASLVYKPLTYEMLVQRPAPQYKNQPFDGDYVAGECSGLDDMFPTIDACYYDRYPWAGTKMADHGEVWSLAWQESIEGDGLRFSVNGVRFPYHLEKQAHFTGEGVLRLDYKLTNLSGFDFDFVWAAHPMFNLEEGAELVLPDGVEQIVVTFDIPGKLGAYGDVFSWPVCRLRDGSPRDLHKMRPKAARDAYKYFVKGKMPEGWCGVKYPRSNISLVMSFPVEQVPYLGVLPNEGGWQDLYNIFLEPCTAPFDRPDAARYRGQVSTLRAGAVYTWHLNLILAEGTGFRRANPDGSLEG